MSPDSPATDDKREEEMKIYADLVSIYPENEEYLLHFAKLLIREGKETTAANALKRLHALLSKHSPEKASALLKEFPQIGRVTKAESEQKGNTEFGEILRKALGSIWIRLYQKRIKEGDYLYHAGDRGDTLSLVIDGEIAVFVPGDNGKIILHNLIGSNDIVGEACFLNPGIRNADIIANRDSTIVELPRKKLLSCLIKNPAAEKLLEEKANFREVTSSLSSHELLQNIPLDMRKYMAGMTKVERYKPDTLIRRAGQEVDAVDMVVRGKVAFMLNDKNNKYQPIGILQPGELIGDTSALRKATCPADIMAVSEALVAHIPLSSFTNVVEAYPPFKEKLLKHAQKQRAKIMQMVTGMGNKPDTVG
ncbi:MAG: cyclic nucleotide-binding domain-containing protein [Mariprofundaceae bacterium]|nr:cyclic nucleotide-binding domain-containing protein [Mariprofundaceae bacterium]